MEKNKFFKFYHAKFSMVIFTICKVDKKSGETGEDMRACTDHPFIVTSNSLALLSTPSVLSISEVYAYLRYTRCTLSTTQVTFTINYTSMFVLSGPKSSVYLQSHQKHYKFIIYSLAQLNERTTR